MPTYDEDIAAAAAALRKDTGAEDEDEVQRFVVLFRALMASREGDAPPPALGGAGDIPLLFAFPSDPLSSADRELLQRARARIDELLAVSSPA